ncbi:MAG: gamma carbonic anhydrase family protein [Halanaeroarchaeum sp.]
MSDSRSYPFEGTEPTIHEDAHVSREAVVVGDVRVEADASVWPGVVIRGDVGSVRIGRGSHVGDNTTVHASEVGEAVMVGHSSVLNDATVGDHALVGFNAVVNTDVRIGARSVVAAGTTIQESRDVPRESFVRGVPARVTPLAETDLDVDEIFESYSSGAYTDLARRHDALFE